jgi:hypothetical protein
VSRRSRFALRPLDAFGAASSAGYGLPVAREPRPIGAPRELDAAVRCALRRLRTALGARFRAVEPRA